MIWIIGNKGMLGQEISRTLTEAGIPFTGSDMEVSILEPSALRNYAEKYNPSWIVNCSAYTAVDRAEEDTDTAYAVNRNGAANLAVLAAERDIPMVHISTDYVFDGTSSTPLTENAPTGPTGVYGASKLAGEEEIRRIWKKHVIIRTAWLYGLSGSNFVYTMIKLMNKLDSLKVVNDQYGSPSWTGDLANLILRVLRSDGQNWGTYHFSGDGECSWYDFAGEIFRIGRETGLIGSDCAITPCTSEEFPTPAKRPAYSLLSKEKVKRIFSIEISNWQDSLQTFMKGIDSNDIL